MNARDWHAADTLQAYEEQAMELAEKNAVTDYDIVEEKRPTGIMRAPQQAVANTSPTPADLVRYAMDREVDLDRLERLMDMQMKWEQREAHKAYTEAMADFKRNAPTINQDKYVSFETGKGTTAYSHATIGNVTGKIIGALAEHGFSHRWIPARGEGGLISVTCEITHKLGHSETTTLEAGLDQSGGKNNIQSMASTITYLERYTLLAATGLAVKDQMDDDGAGNGQAQTGSREPLGISEGELADLRIAMRDAEDEEALLRIGNGVPTHATDAQKAELASEYTKCRRALKAAKGA
jgi:hypothetical protein